MILQFTIAAPVLDGSIKTAGDFRAKVHPDDGVGIPPEERDRVFERGYTTAEEGTGSGFRIVKQVVDAHDWQIDIAGSASGGTQFEITGVEFAE